MEGHAAGQMRLRAALQQPEFEIDCNTWWSSVVVSVNKMAGIEKTSIDDQSLSAELANNHVHMIAALH
jgi:hypothetical protein